MPGQSGNVEEGVAGLADYLRLDKILNILCFKFANVIISQKDLKYHGALCFCWAWSKGGTLSTDLNYR
jgi:hypothetical protein